jgi:sec-independent protein translocase protein TatC
VALTLMGRVGLITSEQLARNRKYAIVAVFAVAAILTPPDVISQIGLGVPILILYELSIIAVRIVERRRAQAEAAEAAAERAAAGTELDGGR